MKWGLMFVPIFVDLLQFGYSSCRGGPTCFTYICRFAAVWVLLVPGRSDLLYLYLSIHCGLGTPRAGAARLALPIFVDSLQFGYSSCRGGPTCFTYICRFVAVWVLLVSGRPGLLYLYLSIRCSLGIPRAGAARLVLPILIESLWFRYFPCRGGKIMQPKRQRFIQQSLLFFYFSPSLLGMFAVSHPKLFSDFIQNLLFSG